jgi:alpha-glucosidase
MDENELPIYSVDFEEKAIITQSHLGIRFEKASIDKGLEVINIKRKKRKEKYELVAGKSRKVLNHYNEIKVSLIQKEESKRKCDLIFRAYNDGAAFRYVFPVQDSLKDFQILAEQSEFRFTDDYTCWAMQVENFTTNYERATIRRPLSSIGPDSLIALPITLEVNDDLFVALTEANLTDYAGMYLEGFSEDKNTLVSKLSPLPDSSEVCVKASFPHTTPWRVIMIGETPGDLIESNLVLNLNEPCAISDVSWIKPGKTAWPWWSNRVVTGVDFEGGMNTATQKHYIDFASEFSLEYLLIDAKWYGDHKDRSEDITTSIPEIDIPEIVEYANKRNVDVILWINWKNTQDQMDKAFPLYEQWGIKGVKVDYMNRDDQEMVNYYHSVIKKAAEHHLLVNFHGAYKPAGIRRTYPNLITREGVKGLEYTKWSSDITPEHNVTIPFTRMLAGPMDYTPGAFHNVTEAQFVSQYKAPTAMGTRCHHLAMFVVYESPLQMVSDYPGSYRGQLGSELLRGVPSTWDETKVLAGEIGDFIVIARRNKNDWFIGAMTDWSERSINIPLQFLDKNKYNAIIYSDGTEAEKRPVSIKVTNSQFTSKDKLTIKMVSGGGYVVHLTPGN